MAPGGPTSADAAPERLRGPGSAMSGPPGSEVLEPAVEQAATAAA